VGTGSADVKIDVRPNLVDRAIAFVSPAAGEQRMAARMRMAASAAIIGGGIGGYRGGQQDRGKRRSWFARARSANADILPGSDRLRAEQRDAAMNQPIATAAINRKTTFTIGTGLMALPAINGAALGLTSEEVTEWQLRIAADYDAYMSSKDVDAARQATGYGVQSIMERGALTSGDILALRVLPENQPGRVIETAWKLVEADRLRNPPNVAEGAKHPQTGNRVWGGVEIDGHDAPVAYHILKQHPGDTNLTATISDVPERIEAWDTFLHLPNVVHVFKKERPEATRGVGMLATVLEPLKMASDLSDAELYAAVMSAMIAVVYKSPGAGAMPEPDYGDEEGLVQSADTPAPEGAPANQYRFESGSVMEIDSDAEVEIKSPGRPNSAFDPFFQAIVRQIGAAIGIPSGVLMLMFNSSYTASKAELEALYMDIRAERAWFAADWGVPPYVCFIAEKVARGDYDMPGFFSDLAIRAAWTGVDWRGDGKISLNPLQEAKGYEVQEAHGWRTGEDITAELTGGSFRENIARRGAEHRAWLKEGLPVATPAGSSAATQPEEAAPAKDEKEDVDA
jgi:lambda family phage portal protein